MFCKNEDLGLRVRFPCGSLAWGLGRIGMILQEHMCAGRNEMSFLECVPAVDMRAVPKIRVPSWYP